MITGHTFDIFSKNPYIVYTLSLSRRTFVTRLPIYDGRLASLLYQEPSS